MKPAWRRSESDRIVAGTLAGAARALGVNPAVTRVMAIGVSVILPLGVLAGYVVVSLLLPREDGRTLLGSGAPRRDRVLGWAGVVLTFFLVTGAAVGKASLVFAYADARILTLSAAATLAVLLRAGVARRARPAAAPRPDRPAPPDDPRPVLAWAACASVLGACAGVLAGLPAGAILAIPVGLVGAAVVLAPTAARARLGIAAAVVAATAAAAAIGAGGRGREAVGRVVATPAVLPAGASAFRLGMGELRVDLRRTRLPAGAASVRATVDVGRVVVLLPAARPRLRASADAGLGVADVQRGPR